MANEILLHWTAYWDWAGKNDIHRWTEEYYARFLAEMVPEEVPEKIVPPPIIPKPTVTVVNRSQQVVTSGLRPESAYSRLVALELYMPAGIGEEDFCYTPHLGNNLILYGIDFWAWCPVGGAHFGGFVYLMSGVGEPKSAGEVATQWTPIVPLSCGLKPALRIVYCEHIELHFTMKKLYRHNAIRFAVAIENFANQDWDCTVLFQISEG